MFSGRKKIQRAKPIKLPLRQLTNISLPGSASSLLAPSDKAKAVKTLRQNPATQQTTSAMELIVSISKPISCLGETLTVGHLGPKLNILYIFFSKLCYRQRLAGRQRPSLWRLTTARIYRLVRLNKMLSLRSEWKKTPRMAFFPHIVLIAGENQETERLLLHTSETSAGIGLT